MGLSYVDLTFFTYGLNDLDWLRWSICFDPFHFVLQLLYLLKKMTFFCDIILNYVIFFFSLVLQSLWKFVLKSTDVTLKSTHLTQQLFVSIY